MKLKSATIYLIMPMSKTITRHHEFAYRLNEYAQSMISHTCSCIYRHPQKHQHMPSIHDKDHQLLTHAYNRTEQNRYFILGRIQST